MIFGEGAARGPRIALATFVGVVFLAAAYFLTRSSWYAPYVFLGLFFAPAIVVIALTRPILFPYGLYVALVPFDNLLGQGQFGTLTKLLGIVAGAFLLLWLLRKNRLHFRGRPVMVLGLLVTWMLLTTVWALDQMTTLWIIPTYAGLFALYVALTMTPITRREFDILLVCVVVGGIAAAIYGADIFYTHPQLAASAQKERLVVKSATTRIDPNHFGAALLFPAAIIMMWSLRTKRILFKLLGIGALGLVVLAVVLSGSRGAFSSFGVITLYYLIRSRHRFQLGVILAILTAALASTQTSMWARFGLALQTGGSGRTSIWAVGLEAAKHRPIFGYGLGNFQQAYDLFYLHVHQTYPYGFSSPAHNILVHYIVELGVVGLVLLGWFFWAQFRSLKTIDRSNDLYDYRIMLEASLIAIAVMALTIDLLTYKYAWVVFAATALLANLAPASQASAAMRRAKPSMIPARSARF